MTNAELIAELRGHIREVPLTLLRDAADALEAADKRIAELEKRLPSAQQEPKWILCSERMPEEDVKVLISYRYKEGEGDTSHVNVDITSYGQMYFGGREVAGEKLWRPPFQYFSSNYEVIAWMPLPEPWKGEQGMIDLSKKYALLENGDIEPLQYEDGSQRNAYRDWDGLYYLDHDTRLRLGSMYGYAYQHDRIVKTSDTKAVLMSTRLYAEKHHPEILKGKHDEQ